MMTTTEIRQIHNITVIGDCQKPAIIFAHGFGTDQSAWQAIKDSFAKDYQVILYDNIGSGKVSPSLYSPTLYSSLHSYANDLIDICEALHIRDAVLVGHSVSGIIGLLAAIKSPDFFSHLICLNSSPRYLNDPKTGYVGGFDQSDVDQVFESIEQNYFMWVSGFAPIVMNMPHQPGLGANLAQTLFEIRPDIALQVAKTIFLSDYRFDLPFVTQPVSLITSEEDSIVPESASEYMKASLSNCQLITVRAKGHLPHMSAPIEIIKAIQSLL